MPTLPPARPLHTLQRRPSRPSWRASPTGGTRVRWCLGGRCGPCGRVICAVWCGAPAGSNFLRESALALGFGPVASLFAPVEHPHTVPPRLPAPCRAHTAGLVLVTHFTLLLGMAAPLWLSNAAAAAPGGSASATMPGEQHHQQDVAPWLAAYAGILVLGERGRPRHLYPRISAPSALQLTCKPTCQMEARSVLCPPRIPLRPPTPPAACRLW